jgi:hypothetical protein
MPLHAVAILGRLQNAGGVWEDLAAVLRLLRRVRSMVWTTKASDKATALALQTLRREGDQYRASAEKEVTGLRSRWGKERRNGFWSGLAGG